MLDLNTKGIVKREIDEIRAFIAYNVSDDSVFLSKNKLEMFENVIEEAKNSPYVSEEELELLKKEKDQMEKYHKKLVQDRKDKETVMYVYRKLIGDVSPEELEQVKKIQGVVKKKEIVKPIRKIVAAKEAKAEDFDKENLEVSANEEPEDEAQAEAEAIVDKESENTNESTEERE